MYGFSHRNTRPVTCEVLDLAEQGVLSWEQIARDALNYMSESQVADMAESNGYVETEDE
jgi:hypothetical protein